jgi:recombination protein RecR
MKYPKHVLTLLDNLKRFPGVGNKTAERYLFRMLDWKPGQIHEMIHALQNFSSHIAFCHECGCMKDDDDSCPFCSEARTACGVLCVIASPKEAYAIEATGEYRGLYHVLGGLLSPMVGVGPEILKIDSLKRRVQNNSIEEIVICLDATLEGDATSLYLKRELEPFGKKISRLAFGLPLGSSLDYIDGSTLARALSGRNSIS